MNIAINPEAPQYRASVKLTPIEPKDMKVTNRYKSPTSKWAGNMIVIYFAGIVLWALISLT